MSAMSVLTKRQGLCVRRDQLTFGLVPARLPQFDIRNRTIKRLHSTSAASQHAFASSAQTQSPTSTQQQQQRADPRKARFWDTSKMVPQDGKTFLVTGSTTGMGFYTAKALAAQGAHVIVAARNLQRCQQAAKMIEVLHLLSDLEPPLIVLWPF